MGRAKFFQSNLIALGLIFFIYLGLFFVMPKSVFWSPDEGAKYIQLQMLGWDHGLHHQIPYPGYDLDPNYQFYPHRQSSDHEFYSVSLLYPTPLNNGQVELNWPIWFPLLSTIPFRLFGTTGLYLIPGLSGLLIVILTGRLAFLLWPKAVPFTVVSLGLASPIFFYSFLFWEHTLAVLLGLIALWQMMCLDHWRWWRPVLILILLLGAMILRTELIFFSVALLAAGGIALFIHRRKHSLNSISLFSHPSLKKVIIACAGLILILVCLGYFRPSNWQVRSQNVYFTHGLMMLQHPKLWLILPARLRDVWINTAVELGPNLPGWVTWLGLSGVVIALVAGLWPGRMCLWLLVSGGILLGFCSAYTLFAPLEFRTIHSLFLPAPFMIFAGLFWPYARDQASFKATTLLITTLLYGLLGTGAVIIGVHGGLEWGARYLLMTYPLLALCAGVGTGYFYREQATHPNPLPQEREQLDKLLLSGVLVGLLLLSVIYQIRGQQEVYATKKDLVVYETTLAKIDDPIVTDLYWLPAALATRFTQQEIYTLTRRENLADWLQLVDKTHNRFLFVSFDSLSTNFIESMPRPLVERQTRHLSGMYFIEIEIGSD